MEVSLTIYIRNLAGDVFSLAYRPASSSWMTLYDRIAERYPDVPLERILLFRGQTMNMLEAGPFQEGECLDLLICDPFEEKWMGSSSCMMNDIAYERSCMMWYEDHEHPSKAPLTVYVFQKEGVQEGHLAVEGVCAVVENTRWFSSIEEAFRHFQAVWNAMANAERCTDTIVSHLIHLWNLNHYSSWIHYRKGRYYDY